MKKLKSDVDFPETHWDDGSQCTNIARQELECENFEKAKSQDGHKLKKKPQYCGIKN